MSMANDWMAVETECERERAESPMKSESPHTPVMAMKPQNTRMRALL